MFSRDEMQRAIEDALQTMEGVALELYRRGREEAREELEEARARNADMRAMLEQVTRERDEARADLARSVAAWESAGMQGRTAHDAMLALAKERDEARAERDAAIARITEVGVMVATNGNLLAKDAYRRGAEAMREACAEACWSVPPDAHPSDCAFAVNAMPIPEEP